MKPSTGLLGLLLVCLLMSLAIGDETPAKQDAAKEPAAGQAAAASGQPTAGQGTAGQGTEAKTTPPAGPKAIGWSDAIGWKSAQAATLSPDGQWLAYRMTASEGDGELILRNTKKKEEKKFPIGEQRRPQSLEEVRSGGFSGGSTLSFSDDSKYLVFSSNPPALKRPGGEAAAPASAAARPAAKMVLLDLETGKTTDFEKVRRAAFAPENARWLALHRESADATSGAAPAGAAAAGAAGAARPGGAASERPTGSDLVLRELRTGLELNIGNVSQFAFDKKGQWLAVAIDAAGQAGNGVQLRHLESGTQMTLESGKASYRGLNWNEAGDALAVLKGVEDKAFDDKLFSLVAFTELGNKPPKKIVYDPQSDSEFPKGMTISANRTPVWSEELDALFFGIQEAKKKTDKPATPAPAPATPAEKPAVAAQEKNGEAEDDFQAPREAPSAVAARGPAAADKPDVVIWHWQDPRLQSVQQVQATQDKNFSYLCMYRVKEKKFFRLADEKLRNVTLAPKHKWAVGNDVTPYELSASLDGQRHQDVHVIDLQTGERRLAIKKFRAMGGVSASPAGTHAVYYDDGQYYLYEMAGGKVTCLTAGAATRFVDEENDVNVSNPPTPLVGWSADGKAVLISDGWDMWQCAIDGSAPTNLTGDGKKEGVRYRRRLVLDFEEKGIDLKKPVYVTCTAEWTKKAGIAVLEAGKSGGKKLLWEDAAFDTLLKAKKADVLVFTRETHVTAPEYYSANLDLANETKLTDLGSGQSKYSWSKGARLIEYTGTNGKRLQGALHLPADYDPSKRYPTIVYIYERLSGNLNQYDTPRATGFSRSVYTSHGYAVLEPDIAYKVNDPGKSAVWCILPALEAAIATGVVDRERVGLHGHSWGGYQTAFMVTQTNSFKAAVAGAPLTNMISMYSSIYWNSGSANQPIFERAQGRFTAGYWEEPEAYTRNSPVYHAKNVNTPLLILHNDRDGAVDWNQGIEYYNTLRRLGKPVVMLQYKGENHGLMKAPNQRDYARRMKEFFDHHLKGEAAPTWWTSGVPYLKLEEHIKEVAGK